VSACVKLPAAANVQVLAVAQTNTGAGGLAKFPPKGWLAIHATGLAGGAATCSPAGDGGVFEASDDGGTIGGGQGGCSCRATGSDAPGGGGPLGAASLGLAALAVALRARSSRSSSSRPRR
jgi:hypothetical protein